MYLRKKGKDHIFIILLLIILASILTSVFVVSFPIDCNGYICGALECDLNVTECECCCGGLWYVADTVSYESGTVADCCGNLFLGEHYNYLNGSEAADDTGIAWSDDQSIDACCNAASDCVGPNEACYADNLPYTGFNPNGNDNTALCNWTFFVAPTLNDWVDCDSDIEACVNCGLRWIYARETSAFGEYNNGIATECCGDDADEYYTTQGIGSDACCNDPPPEGCTDRWGRCQGEYSGEITCMPWDGFDDDCDGWTDCSDDDCALDSDCVGCEPEICDNDLDDDCDHYIDCADNDCLDDDDCATCNGGGPPIPEDCSDGVDNDCDLKEDCADNDCIGSPYCQDCRGGQPAIPENCNNGEDDDCDGFIDNSDWDCPGCPRGTTLCDDRKTCSDDCLGVSGGIQGCIENPDEICEEGEGCACDDCKSKRDSCSISFVCDPTYQLCLCPPGTISCPDGNCKESCNVCGNEVMEPGEECDGEDFGGIVCNPDVCTGTLKCREDCKVDADDCKCDIECDPKNKGDAYCCVIVGEVEPVCDQDCKAISDGDCACTSEPDDCCSDTLDYKCDTDCISGVDPDCLENCFTESDDCCNGLDDGTCDPDCEEDADPDCIGLCTPNPGDCCNPSKDFTCDDDCIPGVDPDCKCGNLLIDSNETCDRTNLLITECSDLFPDHLGVLECFAPGTQNECHYDTSGCYEPECINDNDVCEAGEDCRCDDCLGEQATCGYGQVCSETARCVCEDGTTLCADGTCRARCETLPECDGDGECELGEGCSCSTGIGCVYNICLDCKGKLDTCESASTCLDGICTSCSILEAYWTEECIGSGIEVSMIAEGTPGCAGQTVTFEIPGTGETFLVEFKEDSKAEQKWKKDPIVKDEDSDYYFKVIVSPNEFYESEELEVLYCIPACDADCDGYCDTGKVKENGGIIDTVHCGPALTKVGTNAKEYCETTLPFDMGDIKIDANAMSGWCEDCSPDGLSPGQETCAAYFDCTPNWWKTEPSFDPMSNWSISGTVAETALEWTECDEATMMRTRQICPSGEARDCCNTTLQEDCYCRIPGPEAEGLGCDNPSFMPSTTKACLAEEKFPFFTSMNIVIAVLILIGFYLWKTKTKIHTKKKRKARKKR